MTLTTEQLRAIAEEELDACATLDAAKLMARELLANREAQPVGYAENGKGFIYPPERRDRIQNPVAVFTAPPAPAVPSFDEWLESTGTHPVGWVREAMEESYNACRAAMLNHVVDANEKTAEKCECSSIDYCENCLRAMLAQPVSSGYKVVPVELTDRMIDAFNETPGTLSIEDLWRALLAAAPEGGN